MRRLSCLAMLIAALCLSPVACVRAGFDAATVPSHVESDISSEQPDGGAATLDGGAETNDALADTSTSDLASETSVDQGSPRVVPGGDGGPPVGDPRDDARLASGG